MLAPCNVIDAEPVPARFDPRIRLTLPASKLHNCVTLPPDRCPAVTTARLDPCTPCPTLHLTDVSDTHSVASHPVCPPRARPVYATVPILVPCTVTDTPPLATVLIPCTSLSPATSVDHACVTLPPDRCPAVTTARLDPCTPCPTLHLTDVSDTHSVASHPVCPPRARPVYATVPILVPCTVTDTPPLATVLIPCTSLSPATSVDHACVTLPDR